MKKTNGKIFLGLMVAVVALGIGYAAISGVNLIINGSATAKSSATQEDFKVAFDNFTSSSKISYNDGANTTNDGTLSDENKTLTLTKDDITASATVTSTTEATVSVTGLTTTDETVTLPVIVKNSSDDLYANLANVNITNSNEDYFNIDYQFENNKNELAPGESTTILVTVKAIAIPKVEDKTSNFTVTFDALPEE